MSIRLEPQIYSTFLGIRECNGVNVGGAISAIKADNVELFQTELGTGIGLRSTTGNVQLYNIEGFELYGCFNSKQDGIEYLFIYGENEEKGVLYFINHLNKPEMIIDNLPLTGECNGLTMTSSAYDVFVFTNGEKAYSISFAESPQPKKITAVDYQGRVLKWLAMTVWNGFLVVASQYGVHSSHQNDIFTWNDDPQNTADSWHIDFSKKVTAVFAFSSGVFIFTEDDISRLTGSPNDSNSLLELVAMNGTLNPHTVLAHDVYLFFYDPKQKNIYFLEITDTGQTRPNGAAAKEVQSCFDGKIDKFKMYSCINAGKNELWLLINDYVLIYDYTNKEWLKRREQSINSVCLHDKNLLSCGKNGKVYIEKINDDFDGEFIPAEYQTAFINFGSNSDLKKQKTPLLLVLNSNYTNDFFVELTINGKKKNPKLVKITEKLEGVYGNESDDLVIAINQQFDSAVYAVDNPYSKKVVEISSPDTWYTMSARFYTTEKGQGFAINSLELKNIKAKTKTRGR